MSNKKGDTNIFRIHKMVSIHLGTSNIPNNKCSKNRLQFTTLIRFMKSNTHELNEIVP